MENYLYFRTEATLANDDAAADSALFPVSSFLGMQPTSDTALTLYFKNMVVIDVDGMLSIETDEKATANAAVSLLQKVSHKTVPDKVILNITTNKHKEVMQAICNTMTQSQAGFINVADDVSGAPSYLHANITSCGAITQEAAGTFGNPSAVQVSAG